MQISVIGAGAMGSVFGGFLHAHGESVHFYEIDDEIVQSIRSSGLRIRRPDNADLIVEPPISVSPDGVPPADVVFVFTKSFDTEQAIEDAQPFIYDDSVIVTVQNGIRNMDIIAKHIPRERVIGGYTHVGSNTVEPGTVEFMGQNGTVIGGRDFDTVSHIAELLTDAGIETDAVRDPEPHIWKKQLHNVARKPIAVLTELPNGPHAEFEETREVARKLIEEAMRVAEAKGIDILIDDPVGSFLEPEPPHRYYKKSSILEDVENERRTEIDHINGAIVEYAKEEGIDVPYNWMATELVKAKERGFLTL